MEPRCKAREVREVRGRVQKVGQTVHQYTRAWEEEGGRERQGRGNNSPEKWSLGRGVGGDDMDAWWLSKVTGLGFSLLIMQASV